MRILIVEDSEEDAFLLLRQLRVAGYEPVSERVASADAMTEALQRQEWDVVISDYVIPGFGGLEALALFRERGLEPPFIVVSGHIGEDLAVAAIKAGADDYLMKDRLARLGPAIERALEKAEIRRAHNRSNQALRASEERFRQLAENIGAAFFMFEQPTETSAGVVSYVSPAYQTIWGCSCESLFSEPESWLSAIHPQDQAGVLDALTRICAGDLSQEFRIVRSDGSLRWVHLRTFPVRNEQGEVYRVAALAEDTTLRKYAEERLRESNEELSQAHAQLERRVQERTADLIAANSELHRQMQERKRLENELLEIAENERRRIGFDLHDDIGQKLMGVSLMLKALETNLAHENLPQAEEARKVLGLLEQAVNHTHDLAHCFAAMDRPDRDLPVLLKTLVANVQRTFPLNCQLRVRRPLPSLSPEVSLQLYKIAQESISNAIKHGKATRVSLSLSYDAGKLTLQIKNDGTPFPIDCEPSNRLGLRIMNYRARTIGGTLDMRANGRSGTLVTCIIPCDDAAKVVEPPPQRQPGQLSRNATSSSAPPEPVWHESNMPAIKA